MKRKLGYLRILKAELPLLAEFMTGRAEIINSNFKIHNIRLVDDFKVLEMPYFEFAIECEGIAEHEPGYINSLHLKQIENTKCYMVVND